MGSKLSRESTTNDAPVPEHIDFEDFDILRSIGKGSFGKVCIVKRKKTASEVYAMKYMSKSVCWKQNMIDHVLRELEILSKVEHPFLVNLWFTFQDDEDIFMVSDLLLGGDLRYHIQKGVQFTIDDVRIYVCELASVLEYLESKNIVHRDIKPDNILLDEKGHPHLTDFNIATVLTDQHPTSNHFAGTKPYAAPEVFKAGLREGEGYKYEVDWWSLGVTMYEVLRHKRPFEIDGDTSYTDAYNILKEGTISVQTDWPDSLKTMFFKFFKFNTSQRLCNVDKLYKLELFSSINQDEVLTNLQPKFIPSQTHLNYDPTYELEELIIESNPLHKKKQRILKRKKTKERKLQRMNSETASESNTAEDLEDQALIRISEQFQPFNRKWQALKSTSQSTEQDESSKLSSSESESDCINEVTISESKDSVQGNDET
uniref:non-specific serine/threonine protein kinase n=1 Tax=Phallusia mammillata TaxID=59560 RepID=A0A6F9DTZ7_9ASCI|nr:serine/threonine-protein kinase 32A [Phallusia mammillata]